MKASPEIVALVEEWFAAASRGDPALVDVHVSQDEANRLIGAIPTSG
jgi:hypothetical protein